MLIRPLGGSSRLVSLGTFLLPVAGLVVARCVLPRHEVQAATGVSSPSLESVSIQLPDDHWMRSLTDRPQFSPIEGTPFYYSELPAEEPTAMNEGVDMLPPLEEVEVPPPEVRVSAIMRSGKGCLALIDGKATTIGAVVAKDWLLSAIDEQRRTVTLQNASDGREVVIALDPPF